MAATAPDDEDIALFNAWLADPTARLFVPTADGAPGAGLAFDSSRRRDLGIWSGYLEAAGLLLRHVLERRASSLIFPALFNLRHGIEVGLKWHIEYAGGVIPKQVGHDLEALVDSLRQTAEGLDDDATYICEFSLGLISELGRIDPGSITFRYSTKLDGSSIHVSDTQWDIRYLSFAADMIWMWFDHLSGWIDMSTPEFQARMREVEEARERTGNDRPDLASGV